MYNIVKQSNDITVDRIRGYNEAVRTKLKPPLLPNITYQLSFDVSLSENCSSASKFEAYLSKNLIVSSGHSYIPISDPTMFFENPTYSVISNGWQRITFTIPARAIAGEEYLYLGGGLSRTSKPTLSPIPSLAQNPTCTQTGGNSSIPYYFVDNVSLVPVNYRLNIPEIICLNESPINLVNYIIPTNLIGSFSGTGVSGNIFNPNIAGVGSHLITFTYVNSLGCITNIFDTINVYVNSTVPNFVSIPTICSGTFIAPLPLVSTNGIEGTWSPALNNLNTTTYTFTGSCGTTATLTVYVISSLFSICSSISCQPNLTLIAPETNSYKIYKYKNWVQTGTNYTIANGKTVNFKAEEYILFLPNTHFIIGSTVTANIESCLLPSSKPSFQEEIKNINKNDSLFIEGLNINIVIYPNPFKDDINIQVFGNEIKNIKIVTLDGKIIYNIQDLKTDNYNFKTEILTSGIYIVNIETKSGIIFN